MRDENAVAGSKCKSAGSGESRSRLGHDPAIYAAPDLAFAADLGVCKRKFVNSKFILLKYLFLI